MLGAYGRDFYAAGVVWLGSSFHDACNFSELATDFFDHGAGCTAHRFDGEGAEYKSHHGADEYAAQQ